MKSVKLTKTLHIPQVGERVIGMHTGMGGKLSAREPVIIKCLYEEDGEAYAWLSNSHNDVFDSRHIHDLRWDEKHQAWRYKEITGSHWTPPCIKNPKDKTSRTSKVLNNKPERIAELLAYHWWVI